MQMTPLPGLILASGSPRRKQLLEMLGVSFDILVTDVDETVNEQSTPAAIVEALAVRKGLAASLKAIHRDVVIIAADTLVSVDGEVLGKPTSSHDAMDMLRRLRGRQHEVYSGIFAVDTVTQKQLSKAICTTVFMKEKDDAFLEWYVSTGEPMDKAGSYGIQERGSLLVDKIEGDFYNVVGLPLGHLDLMLSELGRPLSLWMS